MSSEPSLRCARCGIESPERTCFVVPPPYSPSPQDVRCITCEQRRVPRWLPLLENLLSLAGALLWPLCILAWVRRGGDSPLYLAEILMAVLVVPAAVVAHELGHALTGRLLGLEVGAIDIGRGPALVRFALWRVPVRIHAWPFSGSVVVGARTVRLLQVRLWLAVLMGPMTNLALAALAEAFRAPLEAATGTFLVPLWAVTNLLLGLAALAPGRTGTAGAPGTDGRLLLQIPRLKPRQLQRYMLAMPVTRALARCEREDFAGARPFILLGLKRQPGQLMLRVLLSACHCLEREYREAIAVLTPLMQEAGSAVSSLRAAIYNNLAFAQLMISRRGGEGDLEQADRLSAAAFTLFPCVLEYRGTRALVLAATHRPADALPMLDYVNFRWATSRQKASREIARAFALKCLGRLAEAGEAAARAARIDPPSRAWMQILGVAPAAAREGRSRAADAEEMPP